ncbi:TRAP-type C4-dicarboxylate transport system, small permease component [Jannaschia rubra]|uniref:TRAP transporter small permease protein n=2 Tax=Jannaschia rubra TaxID=282197 RepID=A0A0M6XL51_9RHOB|nr:TRAP-type C4-dicarboxylate transport system, small permease component [Jannaschia rubra]SFG77833.1 Tripartite ATP-independent transporter, DctQ component [Jannaschia rubra]
MMGAMLTRILEILSIALLMGLMMVTGLDVVGRYFLNAPLPGAFELTELMLAALVFAALPLVGRAGGHVDVDIVTEHLPARPRRAIALAVAALCALVLLIFAWRLGLLGAQQMADGMRSESLRVPFGPLAWFGAAACILAAVFGLMRGVSK